MHPISTYKEWKTAGPKALCPEKRGYGMPYGRPSMYTGSIGSTELLNLLAHSSKLSHQRIMENPIILRAVPTCRP